MPDAPGCGAKVHGGRSFVFFSFFVSCFVNQAVTKPLADAVALQMLDPVACLEPQPEVTNMPSVDGVIEIEVLKCLDLPDGTGASHIHLQLGKKVKKTLSQDVAGRTVPKCKFTLPKIEPTTRNLTSNHPSRSLPRCTW